jgi:hypothetical protein
LPRPKKHPELRKLYRCHEHLDDQACEAARCLCRTVPTTTGGLIALLAYVKKLGDEVLLVEDEEGDCRDTLLVTLRKALMLTEKLDSAIVVMKAAEDGRRYDAAHVLDGADRPLTGRGANLPVRIS